MAVLQCETETEVQQTDNTDGDDIQHIQSSRIIWSRKLKQACAVAKKGPSHYFIHMEIKIRPSTWQSICKQGQ